MKIAVRLADKKGLLQGDVNLLQESALQWRMTDEIDQEVMLEKERMKYTILAANPHLYKQLYEETDTDEIDDEDVEWIIPESLDEIEKIMEILERQQQGSEAGA